MFGGNSLNGGADDVDVADALVVAQGTRGGAGIECGRERGALRQIADSTGMLFSQTVVLFFHSLSFFIFWFFQYPS
ncbi:MAG TPA: hypothetical protein PKX87_08210 [Alphaproteobacteria bacterium]|nr:hypothetical protein [Alphaproteobacteria bacterium]